MSFGLFSALTNAKADVVVQVTPWTLSFDNGDVFNVMEDDNSLSVVANAFSVTYLDTTGNTLVDILMFFANHYIWKELIHM